MLNKLYESIKKIIKENYIFLSILIIVFFVSTFKLPFYIMLPGGIIDISDRVIVEDSHGENGELNMVYVVEMHATIPTYLLGLLFDDWDIFKEEDITNNVDVEKIDFVNRLALEEANLNAMIVAFNESGESIEVKNEKVYVSHVFNEAKTNLEIGDQILEINNQKVNNKLDLLSILDMYTTGDEITIKTDNGDKTAELITVNENAIIGIQIIEIKDVVTDLNVDFNFNKSESGPSGGLMMSLSIYNSLIEEDITKGRNIIGTGTIDELGNVGAIGGIKYKIKTAIKNDADIFFLPYENYEEAKQVVLEDNLEINLVPVNSFEEAISYLK